MLFRSKEPSEVVARAFGEQVGGGFGPEQIIPKPFDPRLIVELAPAVARAAMDSGVATRPIADFEAYRDQLSQFVFKSGLIMRPIFEQARRTPKRVIFSAGEDDRVQHTRHPSNFQRTREFGHALTFRYRTPYTFRTFTGAVPTGLLSRFLASSSAFLMLRSEGSSWG